MRSDFVEPIRMNNKFFKIFINPLIGNFNSTTKRGWFGVSLKDYEGQELENKVFNEEWDIVDATYPGESKYHTWLKVTYFGDRVPVKVTYINGTHQWKSVKWLLDEIKDISLKEGNFQITDIGVKPYKYTDDYGHDRVAGQLQFIKVEMDTSYYPKHISEPIDIPEEVEEVVPKLTHEEIRDKINAIYGGYKYLDDIPNKIINGYSKTKIEQDIEEDAVPKLTPEEKGECIYMDNQPVILNKVTVDIRKKKLMNALKLIDMEPKEAMKILMEEVL